ncbi:MAG: GNAT family N-acetyltransferase [Burkholderiaceae bacterium]
MPRDEPRGESSAIKPPVPLASSHVVDEFDCGEPVLNEWLGRRALGNQASGASRTFVVTDDGDRVLGYYALAAGAVSHAISVGSVRRNMPDPVPVLVLARLAVDRRAQGRHLGGALLRDALERAKAVSRQAGVRALLVHAIDDGAQAFYEHYGFQPSPIHPLTLMLRLAT